MESTAIWKKIVSKSFDMESNRQMKENARKNARTEINLIRNVSKNSKNVSLEKISKIKKINFKYNFENDLK